MGGRGCDSVDEEGCKEEPRTTDASSSAASAGESCMRHLRLHQPENHGVYLGAKKKKEAHR